MIDRKRSAPARPAKDRAPESPVTLHLLASADEPRLQRNHGVLVQLPGIPPLEHRDQLIFVIQRVHNLLGQHAVDRIVLKERALLSTRLRHVATLESGIMIILFGFVNVVRALLLLVEVVINSSQSVFDHQKLRMRPEDQLMTGFRSSFGFVIKEDLQKRQLRQRLESDTVKMNRMSHKQLPAQLLQFVDDVACLMLNQKILRRIFLCIANVNVL